MPAGELFDLIWPIVLLTSALISTWVLASARKRFPIYVAFAWAVGVLFLPLVVVPAYLTVVLLWPREVRERRWRVLLPLVYGAVVTVAIAGYYYVDRQSVDAHLARAAEAKLIDDHTAAIREYRRALELEENAHTRKLLAMELVLAGQLTEARVEFEKYLASTDCTREERECEAVRERIRRMK